MFMFSLCFSSVREYMVMYFCFVFSSWLKHEMGIGISIVTILIGFLSPFNIVILNTKMSL